MELYKPFAPSGTLTSQARISDILDKGVGALILIDGKITCSSFIQESSTIKTVCDRLLKSVIANFKVIWLSY